MIFNDKYFEIYCELCDKQYTNSRMKWCNPCQIEDLKEKVTKWTNGNEKINNFIQEMQLNVFIQEENINYNCPNTVFEWVPYNQLSNFKKINKSNSVTVYSAEWKDGSLHYNRDKRKYIRQSCKKIAIKCLHNSQNTINEFLNEV